MPEKPVEIQEKPVDENPIRVREKPVRDKPVEHRKMKAVWRSGITDRFQISSHSAVPDVPQGGARVKVLYAGYEVSGVVDCICSSIKDETFSIGDHVIVYPEEDNLKDEGYAEYITVRDVRNLLAVPASMSMEVAAMLPTGALLAYNTVTRLKPFVQQKLQDKPGKVNILIVGAGGLGLWTVRMAKYVLCTLSSENNRVRLVVADPDIDKLMTAKEHGCDDVVHWSDAIHEEYIVDRTNCVCHNGVDVIVDFVNSHRTTKRALTVLNNEGVLVIGGNSKYDVSFPSAQLAERQQVVMGVSRGSYRQLQELVDIVARGQVTPPTFHTFPVDEANRVFDDLSSCKLIGRAVLRVSPDANGNNNSGDTISK